MELKKIEKFKRLIEVMRKNKISVDKAIEILQKNGVDRDKEIILNIDYSKTLEQSISDGHYDWSNEEIIFKNFPVQSEMIGQKISVCARLFNYGWGVDSQETIKRMQKSGCRPANLMELLALGSAFPDLQRQFPIIALGSQWSNTGGVIYTPCLYADEAKRGLDLCWYDVVWGSSFRFLGILVK